MMEREELLKTLQALHDDLSNTEQVDSEAERLLRTVTEDIERLLADNDEERAELSDSQTLSSNLREMVLDWEAEHPKIAQMIGQVADALANLGV